MYPFEIDWLQGKCLCCKKNNKKIKIKIKKIKIDDTPLRPSVARAKLLSGRPMCSWQVSVFYARDLRYI